MPYILTATRINGIIQVLEGYNNYYKSVRIFSPLIKDPLSNGWNPNRYSVIRQLYLVFPKILQRSQTEEINLMPKDLTQLLEDGIL